MKRKASNRKEIQFGNDFIQHRGINARLPKNCILGSRFSKFTAAVVVAAAAAVAVAVSAAAAARAEIADIIFIISHLQGNPD